MISRGHRFGNGEPWDGLDVLVLSLCAAMGMSRSQAAAIVGRTIDQVAGACHRHKISFRNPTQ